ncbi:MAG: serine/threonine-protein kinase [Chloroflexi bacterium]|nr:serine/threonine-protein kinase [Chloroflexota bacterium]
MDAPTIFVIVIALVFTSVPVTVAIIQEVRRRKMRAGTSRQGRPLQQPQAQPQSKHRINGRYELKAPAFKQGGMANIWLARDRASGRKCIIKTPRRGTTMDNVYLDKLQQEAGFLKSLQHPNIVKYLDDFYFRGEFHLVLELVTGDPIMSSSPRSSAVEQKVLAWAGQALDALAYVHAAGIVHRDVNPKNIMLSGNGGIKLIDFGTAKSLESMKRDTVRTDPFTQIANKGFDIPELFIGGESDQRCDLCGLAQTCIYLLTLRQPNDLCTGLIQTNWPRSYGEAGTVADYMIAAGISRRTSRCLAQTIMFSAGSRFASAIAMRSALLTPSAVDVQAVKVPA